MKGKSFKQHKHSGADNVSCEATGLTSVWVRQSSHWHSWKSNTPSYEGDVGGQKTLRSYWRNYFEKTDALIWVVDATDRERISDCRQELASLLLEEVSRFLSWSAHSC